MLYYQLSAASFYIPKAILGILIPYILTTTLLETPENIGIALSIFMLPNLLLLLFAGAMADNFDKKNLLIILQAVNIIPLLGLYVLLESFNLTYSSLLIFALVSGSAIALIQPTIDTLINQLPKVNIEKAVSFSISLMYIMTLFGFLIASFTDSVKISTILFIAILISCAGIFFTSRIKVIPNTVKSHSNQRSKNTIFSDIKLGFKYLAKNKKLRTPVILMSLAGPVLGGPYAVLVPIILHDFYSATALDFSITFACFMLGGALSSGLLSKFETQLKHLNIKQGQLLILGYIAGGFAMLVWFFEPPYWLFLVTQIIWGIGGGICLCTSRTIIQTIAAKEYKARILSIMYLGDEGGSPIGSLLIGYYIAAIGINKASLTPAIITFLIAIIAVIFSNIWRQDNGS